jgi:hypothetical protein
MVTNPFTPHVGGGASGARRLLARTSMSRVASYCVTGHVVDMSEPTRLTLSGSFNALGIFNPISRQWRGVSLVSWFGCEDKLILTISQTFSAKVG